MDGDKEKQSKSKRIQLFETFTKAWVSILMVIAIIDLQLSYVLAYLGRDQIAESLSVAVVTEIIGVMGIYIVRAYFDTATESKHDIERSKLSIPDSETNESDFGGEDVTE